MAGVKVRAKMLNLTRLKRKLERAPIELRREVASLMEEGAKTIEDDVKRQIRDGTKTGRWYTRSKITYRASAPGQAPAFATGALYRTIKTIASKATKPNARVIADGVYRLMEFGTRLMAARPAFLPAWQRHKRPITAKVERESVAVFRKFKV
jgi:hypothetical protein